MIKILFSLFISAFLLIGFTSCQSKLDKAVSKLNDMEKDYIEACIDGDYDKAREIVEKMVPTYQTAVAEATVKINEYVKKHGTSYYGQQREQYSALIKDINEHWTYVNEKEIYKLLANPSRENTGRILYLYNSYEPSQLPDMNDVLEVMVSSGDEGSAERLINSGVTPSLAVVRIAARNDMSDLVKSCVNKVPFFIADDEIQDYCIETFGKGFPDEVVKKSKLTLKDLQSKLSQYNWEINK